MSFITEANVEIICDKVEVQDYENLQENKQALLLFLMFRTMTLLRILCNNRYKQMCMASLNLHPN